METKFLKASNVSSHYIHSVKKNPAALCFVDIRMNRHHNSVYLPRGIFLPISLDA